MSRAYLSKIENHIDITNITLLLRAHFGGLALLDTKVRLFKMTSPMFYLADESHLSFRNWRKIGIMIVAIISVDIQ
jgi:hypothetical protein